MSDSTSEVRLNSESEDQMMMSKRIGTIIGVAALAFFWCSIATAQLNQFNLEWDVDRPGSDYRVFDILTPQRCARACEADGGCRAWTFLVRLRKLPVGNNLLKVFYQKRRPDGQYLSFGNNAREMSFKNDMENWSYWFPAHFREIGQWRATVSLNAEGTTGQILGRVTYCVNCPVE
jgi:hypothetical protein